ncbi:MAG: hypothetical protein K0R29_1035 [Pseudobdellovibrio sp.]|nr:hypothetical protein [Pseudobdellovibrio sp.]
MKKAFVTAFIMFAAAFLLLFSFQKDKDRTNSSGKKIDTSLHHEKEHKESAPSQAKSASANIVQPKPKTTAQQEDINAQPEMNETLEAFFNSMPRTDRLSDISTAELHETPQAVLEAGAKLADVHEYFSTHPQPRDVEMTFYLKCSQQKDFFDSVRAVCAARLSQHYFEATGHQISSEIFDKNIDQLRREINL